MAKRYWGAVMPQTYWKVFGVGRVSGPGPHLRTPVASSAIRSREAASSNCHTLTISL
jgi:hypothetical protein